MEDPGTIFSPLSFCIRVMLETVFDGWDSMSSSQREDPEGGATLSILWFIWAREECREPFTIGRDHWLICGRILFSRNSLAQSSKSSRFFCSYLELFHRKRSICLSYRRIIEIRVDWIPLHEGVLNRKAAS